jgi:hypothetical protein
VVSHIAGQLHGRQEARSLGLRREQRYRDEVEEEPRAGWRPRGITLIAVWIMATLLALGVAATTRIGPILFTLSPRHGVHLGDLLAFAASYATALVITVLVLGRH